MANKKAATSSSVSSSLPSIKIAYIGGGSRYWARDLMKDLALAGLFEGEIRLYDIDLESARRNEAIADRIFSRPEAKSRFKVRAVKTLAACLKGADFVVISIEPGPIEARYADLEIPLKYGIVQPVGDSTGPGGILRGLRSIPVYAGFAASIMEHCPRAWVINYTNPMTLCTRTLYAVAPEIRAFGCCHEVFGTQNRIARLAAGWFGVEKIGRKEIAVDVNGINHFTWVTKASWRGHDLMPRLREYAADPALYGDRTRASRKRTANNGFFRSEGLVAIDLLRRFGVMGAAGDRHLVEFVPWYTTDVATLNRWGVICTPYSYRLKRQTSPDVGADSYSQQSINPSGEEGVQQMAALAGLGDLDTNVNLPNLGQSAGLPLDAVVETNACFRAGSLTPKTAHPLPPGAEALVRRVVDVQEITLRAGLELDLDLAREAILCDPLVNIPTDTVMAMFDEMLRNIAPCLKEYGVKPAARARRR